MMQDEPNLNEISNQTREQTAGLVLRFYRESLGLDLDMVAKHLHVPSNKLKALEDDRLQDLPDTVFARSLALAVCRHLNQDPAPVLQLLPQFDTQRLAIHDERGLNSPIRRPALSTQPFWPVFLHKLSGMRWVGDCGASCSDWSLARNSAAMGIARIFACGGAQHANQQSCVTRARARARSCAGANGHHARSFDFATSTAKRLGCQHGGRCQCPLILYTCPFPFQFQRREKACKPA
jgi:hypothetical protein